jgi:hypothetical protein
MQLSSYVEDFREELAVAAEAGGEDARALAERLTAPLESAVRLMLLEALSAAASEITRDLAPGSVDVRLRGRDPEFVVTSPPADQGFADAPTHTQTMPAADPAPVGEGDEGGTSRTTLRLPESLKARMEQAASREALSVNSWLVRAVTAALEPDTGDHRSSRRSPQGGQRFTGWAR